MSRSGRRRRHGKPRAAKPAAEPDPPSIPPPLPRGRMPSVGMRELVAAVHRRREQRQSSVAGLQTALSALASGVERHLVRIGEVRAAVEAQGGDLTVLRHYDTLMASLRAELRATEVSLAHAFRDAATGPAA